MGNLKRRQRYLYIHHKVVLGKEKNRKTFFHLMFNISIITKLYRGLYLIIYAHQRGVLEVWRMKYGPKVISLVVGNHCKLLTCSQFASPIPKVYLLQRNAENLNHVSLFSVTLPLSANNLVLKYYSLSNRKKDLYYLQQIVNIIKNEIITSYITLTTLLENIKSR